MTGSERPGSSVGTSVRLKSGRSPVRPRPWPQRTSSNERAPPSRVGPFVVRAGRGPACVLVPGGRALLARGTDSRRVRLPHPTSPHLRSRAPAVVGQLAPPAGSRAAQGRPLPGGTRSPAVRSRVRPSAGPCRHARPVSRPGWRCLPGPSEHAEWDATCPAVEEPSPAPRCEAVTRSGHPRWPTGPTLVVARPRVRLGSGEARRGRERAGRVAAGPANPPTGARVGVERQPRRSSRCDSALIAGRLGRSRGRFGTADGGAG